MPSTMIDYLSIWELCIRWAGYNPITIDEKNFPVEAQDLAKDISYLLVTEQAPATNSNGIILKSYANAVSKEFFKENDYTINASIRARYNDNQIGRVGLFSFNKKLRSDYQIYSILPQDTLINRIIENVQGDYYAEYISHRSERFFQYIEGLERTYENSEFSKSVLSKVCISRDHIPEICHITERALPSFWFSEKEIHDSKIESSNGDDIEEDRQAININKIDQFWDRLSSAQRSRLLAREIAKVLWNNGSESTIEGVIKNPIFQEYSGAKYFNGKNTLRDWIKDLDERPQNQKGGRPKSGI